MRKDNFNNKFKRDQKIIEIFIWVIFLLCFLFLIGAGWAVWQITLGVIGLDWTHGAKGVLESFWYGKDIR